MHILANFVIFDDFGPFLIEKMDILDLFWGPQTASCPKVTIYLPLSPWTLSKPVKNPLKTPYFWPLLDPFEGPGGRLWLGPLRAAFVVLAFEQVHKVLVKCVKAEYFWYATFRFTVVSMGFAKVFIYDYFASICKYWQVLCCCGFKAQYFKCV